jgi:hypothetical protein
VNHVGHQVPALGWRRRHPVLSRLLLYVAAAALLGVVAVLATRRSEQNREDHLTYLRKRLDGLGLVYVQDRTGNAVLQTLDREFAEPDLPADIRQRVLRVRGFVHMRQQRLAPAEEAFEAAWAIVEDPTEREALRVEWAEARAMLGDPEGAVTLLDEAPPTEYEGLAIFRALVRTFASGRHGSGQRAQVVMLDDALASLPQPLPDRDTFHMGLRDWSGAMAATDATMTLAQLMGERRAKAAWERLQALAPDSFRAQAEAARGLAAGRWWMSAAAAWRRAVALDPHQAELYADQDPRLARLTGKGEETLQAQAGGGR